MHLNLQIASPVWKMYLTMYEKPSNILLHQEQSLSLFKIILANARASLQLDYAQASAQYAVSAMCFHSLLEFYFVLNYTLTKDIVYRKS